MFLLDKSRTNLVATVFNGDVLKVCLTCPCGQSLCAGCTPSCGQSLCAGYIPSCGQSLCAGCIPYYMYYKQSVASSSYTHTCVMSFYLHVYLCLLRVCVCVCVCGFIMQERTLTIKVGQGIAGYVAKTGTVFFFLYALFIGHKTHLPFTFTVLSILAVHCMHACTVCTNKSLVHHLCSRRGRSLHVCVYF